MERFEVWRPVLGGREPLAAITDHHPLSLRTLPRWTRRSHTGAKPVSATNGVPTEAIILVSHLRSTSALHVLPSSPLRAPWPFSIDASVREPVNAS
jgi:hypothetical protein